MILTDLTEKQRGIYKALSGGLTQAETSGYMNISRASVSQTTRLLIENNLIEKESKGDYKIHYISRSPQDDKTKINFVYIPHYKKGWMGKCCVCGKKFTTSNRNQVYCSHLCKGEDQRGPNHPTYTGNSFFPYCWMYNAPLKERVKAFFDYRCVMCGKDERDNFDRKGRLHKLAVHHVKYNRQACCPPYDKPKDKQFVPLCLFCHNKTSRTKDRKMWLEYFSKLIEEQYGGKCYFTKEEFAPQDQYYKF